MSLAATCDPFLSANTEVAVNTASSTVDLTAAAATIDVRRDDIAALFLYVKGDDAACAEAVDLYLQRSPDGSTWFDMDKLTVTLNGEAQVVSSDAHVDLDLRATRYLRLAKAGNHETVAGRTCKVNAYLQRR